MECLGLHNKPKAEVHPRHKLTGPKEKKKKNNNNNMENEDNTLLRNKDLNTQRQGVIHQNKRIIFVNAVKTSQLAT
jgi:hypothetical protein